MREIENEVGVLERRRERLNLRHRRERKTRGERERERERERENREGGLTRFAFVNLGLTELRASHTTKTHVTF